MKRSPYTFDADLGVVDDVGVDGAVSSRRRTDDEVALRRCFFLLVEPSSSFARRFLCGVR
jgi:hypothetical protein